MTKIESERLFHGKLTKIKRQTKGIPPAHAMPANKQEPCVAVAIAYMTFASK